MRQDLTSGCKDSPVVYPRDPGRAVNCLRIPAWLVGILLAVLCANEADARMTVLVETGSAVKSAISRTTNFSTKLHTPGNWRTGDDEPKIFLAHAIIVKTSPPQGGIAPGNIGKVDVWYDAGIRDSLAALAVVSAAGERIDKRDAAIDGADPAHVSVSVNPMAPGKYTVRYRALSADGHMVSGAWEFDVQP